MAQIQNNMVNSHTPHDGAQHSGAPPNTANGHHSNGTAPTSAPARWIHPDKNEQLLIQCLAASDGAAKVFELLSYKQLKDDFARRYFKIGSGLHASAKAITADTLAEACQLLAEDENNHDQKDKDAWQYAAEVARGEDLNLPRGFGSKNPAEEAMNIARKIRSATAQDNDGKKSQAENLLEIALTESEVFQDTDGEVFATIKTPTGARLTYRLNSTTFRSFLAARHFALHGRMASSSSAFAAVLDTTRGGLMGKTPREVFTRIAHLEGRIYYDLGDDTGRVVEITSSGWKVLNAPPVAFIRPNGMRPQVEPQRGGIVGELRELVNVESDDDFKLLVGFIVGFFQPEGAKSHLAFLGEQGTAKTATTKFLRAILDPNDAPTRSEPREIGDLIVAAKNNALIGFDNISHIPQWFSDFLCRLSTGSGDGKRKLYENDEEVIFAFKRSVVFNAITEVATRPDLLDRTILLELPILPDEKRRRESDMDSDFFQARALILGAIFDAVSFGLKNHHALEIKNLPRMADFAVWVEACAPGFGWEAEEFLNIYRENRKTVHESAADISALARFIIELWIVKNWDAFDGTPSELLEKLSHAAKPNYQLGDAVDVRAAKDWPKDAASLGRQLRRLAPVLRTKGLEVHPSKSNGVRGWKIAKKENT